MKNLNQYQSLTEWDMDVSLEEILLNNEECMADRNYKAHKFDSCFQGYCMYLKHPQNVAYETMIGIHKDGFTYLGDGLPNKDLPMENTLEIVKEMILYRDWVMKKENNKYKLLSKGIDYDCLD